VLVGVFLFTDYPREIAALSAAGLLLTSRRMASRDILALVDWQLLVLFAGLFIVNHALAASGVLGQVFGAIQGAGVELASPGWLFAVTVVLSNLVSNVPAVMLLLPAATHELAGPVLALASTLAGNLFIVGSIANIIVVDQAQRMDVKITWAQHARVGVPVTLLTLAIAAGWLWWLAG
jgi:Na+/H+ antiporter NhaD/arsenite permease-like protein